MNVQIPVKWLQELLALCGPEDHELRERVMVSITAMDEQAAAPVVLPEPDDAYTRRIIEALNENGDPVSVDAAEEMERLRALLVGVSAPADKLRVDALLHFMQANCFNNELNADESRNILFNIDQLREWRSGKHDNYVEKLYGRLHSMGGCEQGQGASAGHSGDASASAGDGLSVAAPQQADARDADGEWQEINTMPTCDDLIWLYCQETNTIDGPIAPDPSLEQFGWTHWAYANAPSTECIDRAAIAIAAAKGE